MTIPATRHPHSQSFHDEVEELRTLYAIDKEWYKQGATFGFLFAMWDGVDATAPSFGITDLCKMNAYLSVGMISGLQVVALTALSILESLEHVTASVDDLLDLMKETHDRKQADYGTDQEPFTNVLASQELGIHPVLAICIRMNDKVTRIKSFLKKGILQNESLDDSLIDIAVYAIIAVVIIQETIQKS